MEDQLPVKSILVLGSQRTNYQALFEGCVIEADGVQFAIKCEHSTWDDVRLTSFGDQGGLTVNISPSVHPLPNTRQGVSRSLVPDFVLLRAGCRGGPTVDHRHKLSVIAHSGVPTLNTIDSFFLSQDKARINGKMVGLRKRLGGMKAFPWIQETCYADWTSALFPPDFPCVVKVGTASGGLGKARVTDPEQWSDMRSVLGMQSDLFTTQQLVPWKYDIRVQKIGHHVRAFRRTGKSWKSNVDMAMKDEDVAVEPRWALWINEAALELGQDICAMDILATEEGDEFILECNSSAIGLNGRHLEEDNRHMRDLVLLRLVEATEKANALKRQQLGQAEPLPTQASPSPSVEALQAEIAHLRGELDLVTKQLRKAESEREARAQQQDTKKKGFSLFGDKK